MECSNCSVSGKELVIMTTYYDESLGATIAVCPKCGKDEVIGFGKI